MCQFSEPMCQGHIATRFSIHSNTVRNVWKACMDTGTVSNRKKGGKPRSTDTDDLKDSVKARIEENP